MRILRHSTVSRQRCILLDFFEFCLAKAETIDHRSCCFNFLGALDKTKFLGFSGARVFLTEKRFRVWECSVGRT